jgi:hypothetical protein
VARPLVELVDVDAPKNPTMALAGAESGECRMIPIRD